MHQAHPAIKTSPNCNRLQTHRNFKTLIHPQQQYRIAGLNLQPARRVVSSMGPLPAPELPGFTNKDGCMNRWTLTAACAATVLGLAACGTSTPTSTAMNGAPVVSTQTTAMPTSTNATLQAYHWYLDKAEDASGQAQPQFKALEPKTPVRLDFNAGSQAGEQTVFTKICNNIITPYQLEGNQLKMGRGISTMMACTDQRLSQLERAVGEQIGRMQSVQMVQGAPQPHMVVTFSDGSRWHMRGEPTDATRYGSAGETIFLEVGPQTKSCTAGAAHTECLQVREIRYDSNWRKLPAGDWQHFYGSIEGFTFEPGVRNLLRLKRYPVKNPAADASAFAYVLDMRVETEQVNRK